MNATKQFWTLLRFHFAGGPFVWILPLAFCTPLLFMRMETPPLNMLLLTQNLFFVVLFGAMMLAPEIYSPLPSNQTGGINGEFLRTRAVDRVVLARAKTTFFFAIMLVAPVAMIVLSLRHPELQVLIFNKASQAACLGSLPGSTMVSPNHPELITIASGNILIAVWRAWIFAILAASVQVFIYAVYPSRLRKWIIMATSILVAFVPMLGTIEPRSYVAWDLQLFFWYAGHQAAFWIAAVAALILGQMWSERRFKNLEP